MALEAKKGKQKMRYAVRDREAGDIIEYFKTKKEAEKALQDYEMSDKAEGIYEENFYEVTEIGQGIYAYISE